MSLSRKDMARIALGLVDTLKRKPRSAHRAQTEQLPRDNRGEAAPVAPPPPKYTADSWAKTCILRETRCHLCEQCLWELDVERWHEERNTYEQDRLRANLPRDEYPTIFRTPNDAMLAAFEHYRSAPSAMGPMMDRLNQGATHAQAGTNYNPAREDPVLRRATNVIEVMRALDEAYVDNRWGLTAAECIAVLRERIGRVSTKLPSYEELAERYKLPKGDVRAIVKYGRRRVTVELAARGVIPMPGANAGLHHDIDVRRTALEGRS